MALKRLVWLLATTLAFCLGVARALSQRGTPTFEVHAVPRAPIDSEAFIETSLVSSATLPSVHSATAVELDDGRVLASWYAGSREGARDVALYAAVLDPDSGEWSAERLLATREETGRDLGRYVKKLGNPVLATDRAGRVWLFYVSVSVGGWSGSAVNARVSLDGGESFSPAQRIVTSPFLNLSTLVRGPAFRYADGGLGLPVYHELVGKFGELVRLGPDGEVLDKSRLSSARTSLQPVVVLDDERHAIAYLRSSGTSPPRILRTSTVDSGRSWGPLTTTTLSNPDAAVSALRLQDGDVLLAFNDSERDRSNLSLALARGGEDFEVVRVVEPPTDGVREPRFAYPWLLQTSDGDIHLLYTWDRARIIHVRFNRAWLTRAR